MRKNPKLNGLICTAYDRAWRSIEFSERAHAPKLFALVESLVDDGHADVEFVAANAVGMLRGEEGPPQRSSRPNWSPGIQPVAGPVDVIGGRHQLLL